MRYSLTLSNRHNFLGHQRGLHHGLDIDGTWTDKTISDTMVDYERNILSRPYVGVAITREGRIVFSIHFINSAGIILCVDFNKHFSFGYAGRRSRLLCNRPLAARVPLPSHYMVNNPPLQLQTP